MTLSDLSIQRPIFTWMIMLALIVFGILGYNRLGIDQFPTMEFPVLTVTAELEGASPEGMEEDVTDVLEEQLNTIAGVRSIESTSFHGTSIVTVEFVLGTDLDIVAQDVTVAEGYAYLASTDWYRARLVVLDISDPAAPASLFSVDTMWSAVGVAAAEGYAYIISDRGFWGALDIIDVTSMAAPASTRSPVSNMIRLLLYTSTPCTTWAEWPWKISIPRSTRA